MVDLSNGDPRLSAARMPTGKARHQEITFALKDGKISATRIRSFGTAGSNPRGAGAHNDAIYALGRKDKVEHGGEGVVQADPRIDAIGTADALIGEPLDDSVALSLCPSLDVRSLGGESVALSDLTLGRDPGVGDHFHPLSVSLLEGNVTLLLTRLVVGEPEGVPRVPRGAITPILPVPDSSGNGFRSLASH